MEGRYYFVVSLAGLFAASFASSFSVSAAFSALPVHIQSQRLFFRFLPVLGLNTVLRVGTSKDGPSVRLPFLPV
jgi:hypothetical protein